MSSANHNIISDLLLETSSGLADRSRSDKVINSLTIQCHTPTDDKKLVAMSLKKLFVDTQHKWRSIAC